MHIIGAGYIHNCIRALLDVECNVSVHSVTTKNGIATMAVPASFRIHGYQDNVVGSLS